MKLIKILIILIISIINNPFIYSQTSIQAGITTTTFWVTDKSPEGKGKAMQITATAQYFSEVNIDIGNDTGHNITIWVEENVWNGTIPQYLGEDLAERQFVTNRIGDMTRDHALNSIKTLGGFNEIRNDMYKGIHVLILDVNDLLGGMGGYVRLGDMTIGGDKSNEKLLAILDCFPGNPSNNNQGRRFQDFYRSLIHELTHVAMQTHVDLEKAWLHEAFAHFSIFKGMNKVKLYGEYILDADSDDSNLVGPSNVNTYLGCGAKYGLGRGFFFNYPEMYGAGYFFFIYLYGRVGYTEEGLWDRTKADKFMKCVFINPEKDTASIDTCFQTTGAYHPEDENSYTELKHNFMFAMIANAPKEKFSGKYTMKDINLSAYYNTIYNEKKHTYIGKIVTPQEKGQTTWSLGTQRCIRFDNPTDTNSSVNFEITTGEFDIYIINPQIDKIYEYKKTATSLGYAKNIHDYTKNIHFSLESGDFNIPPKGTLGIYFINKQIVDKDHSKQDIIGYVNMTFNHADIIIPEEPQSEEPTNNDSNYTPSEQPNNIPNNPIANNNPTTNNSPNFNTGGDSGGGGGGCGTIHYDNDTNRMLPSFILMLLLPLIIIQFQKNKIKNQYFIKENFYSFIN